MACKVQWFDSLGDFARVAAQVPYDNMFRVDSCRNGETWYGHRSYQQAVDLCLNGDSQLVDKALAMLEKMEASLESTAGEWVPSPIGAYPIVPDFLVGLPDCMRRRVEVVSDAAPISVYVDIGSSACFSADVLLKRGIAILALVLKLQAVRSVNLILLDENGGRYGNDDMVYAIQIDSKPLDLGTACYALTDVSLSRRLTFGLAHQQVAYTGAWPANYNGGNDLWVEFVRGLLGMAPHDIYVKAAYMGDPLIESPIDWVNQQVAAACAVSEAV